MLPLVLSFDSEIKLHILSGLQVVRQDSNTSKTCSFFIGFDSTSDDNDSPLYSKLYSSSMSSSQVMGDEGSSYGDSSSDE